MNNSCAHSLVAVVVVGWWFGCVAVFSFLPPWDELWMGCGLCVLFASLVCVMVCS